MLSFPLYCIDEIANFEIKPQANSVDCNFPLLII